MNTYQVKVTDRALADMEEIYQYISETLMAPENAMGQYNRIADTIESLNVFPERVPIMQSVVEGRLRLRQITVDYYAIIFFIHNDTVIVTRVLYSGSDISQRLNNDSWV